MEALGVIGVGALARAMVLALHRAWPDLKFHLSPRNALIAAQLHESLGTQLHASNQQVADTCRTVIIGVRPAQLQELAAAVRFAAHHHLWVLSAGTPLVDLQRLFAPARVTRLMTGLAIEGGHSAISCHPPDALVQALWQGASAAVIALEDEGQFEASVLAVCANAWWLDQLSALTNWLVQRTGMAPEKAQALLVHNMADVARMLSLNPECRAAELARFIGSPGTYTGQGLDHLQATDAHQPWQQALDMVWTRMVAKK